jgi:hypothetical protein
LAASALGVTAGAEAPGGSPFDSASLLSAGTEDGICAVTIAAGASSGAASTVLPVKVLVSCGTGIVAAATFDCAFLAAGALRSTPSELPPISCFTTIANARGPGWASVCWRRSVSAARCFIMAGSRRGRGRYGSA